MSDEPLYDPERMVPEDLDFTDPDVARAYLDRPTTDKLVEDLGRSFRSMPPDYQQAELSDYLSELKERRAQAAAALEGFDRDSPAHTALQQVLDAIDKHIESATLRMLELD